MTERLFDDILILLMIIFSQAFMLVLLSNKPVCLFIISTVWLIAYHVCMWIRKRELKREKENERLQELLTKKTKNEEKHENEKH